MKKYFYCVLHFTIACCILYCFNRLYHGTTLNAVYQNYNILTLPACTGICYVLLKGQNLYVSMGKRKWLFPGLGLLYSIFFVSGTWLTLYGSISFRSLFFYLCILVFFFLMTALILVFYFLMLPALRSFFAGKLHRNLDKICSKTTFLSLWVIIFLCWVPILLACYPGIFSYDANYQCSQVGEFLQLNTHHPVIHTLFLGGCVYFGKSVLHSANTGLLIYSILQMLINSAIFSYCLSYIKKLKVSSIIFTLCFLFYAIMPFNSLLSLCATKDAIFGSLFLLLVLFLCEMALHPDTFFGSTKNPLVFVCTCFLLLIFRNNMLYAFCISIPFFLVIYRKYRNTVLVMLFLPIILLKIYEGILYPALGVTSGDSREAYSVVMQQYASIYNQCELNPASQELLLQLMDDSDWKKYEPRRADAVKNEFRTQNFEENIGTYIKLWVKLGAQHPSQYLNAYLQLTCGYWYPGDVLPDSTTYRKYIEIYDAGEIVFDSKLPWLFEKLWMLGMESSYQNIPVLSLLFSPAAYLWVLLFLSAISFYQRKYKIFTVMLMPASLFLTILLGPVALLRYLYPIILCVPPLCIFCFKTDR